MKQGFNIVIGGVAFQPDALEYSGCATPDVTVQKGNLLRGEPSHESFIEWDCWSEDFGGVDIITEAMDFISANKRGLEELGQARGVEYRRLNVVIAKDCCLELTAANLTMLADIGVALSIVILS